MHDSMHKSADAMNNIQMLSGFPHGRKAGLSGVIFSAEKAIFRCMGFAGESRKPLSGGLWPGSGFRSSFLF
ncbi:MAG: hypothetical protein Q4E18_10065 [Clostridia bacterium]|nr:hypothetical protein [Clostridia bacterium]